MKKITILLAVIFLVGLTVVLISHGNSYQSYACAFVPDVETDDHIVDINTVTSINQVNNLMYTGFSIKLNDWIYFADGFGVHRSCRYFLNVETLFSSEHSFDIYNPRGPYFLGLQYHNGRIFFLDRFSAIIYSMDLDGNDIKPVLNVVDVGAWTEPDGYGRFTEFIVVDDNIYFQLFTASISFKSFNMITGEIVNFGEDISPMLSLSSDGNELHFSFGHSALCLETHTVRDITPKNFRTLFDLDYLFSINNRTISEGKIYVAASSYRGPGRIFYINDSDYLVQIFLYNGIILDNINSLGNWIYFTAIPYGSKNVHLYRVQNDGYELELLYENIATANEHGAQPSIILNIFSEDLILLRGNLTLHPIYALIRDPVTQMFSIKSINP